jgi:hypothetical protein
MGKAPSKPRKDMRERPVLTGVHFDELFAKLSTFYDLRHEDALDELYNELVDIACHELGDPEAIKPTSQQLALHRADAHRLAGLMRDEAAAILISLDHIHAAHAEFNNAIGDTDSLLMEAVFDADPQDPTTTELPAQTRILREFRTSDQWSEVLDALRRMASLPVRPVLDRGPVRTKLPLERAVRACREYWTTVEGHSWSMYRLKETGVRAGNDRRDLTGVCEAFVADLLAYTFVPYDLQALSTAWLSIDAQRRKAAAALQD